jgi:microcystin-dependent protein
MAYEWDKTKPAGTQAGSDMDDAIRDTRAGVEAMLGTEHTVDASNPAAVTAVHKDAFCKTEYLADSAVTTAKVADDAITMAKTAKDSLVPVGAVLPFANSTVPAGWLECNGAAVSRETYADLFAAIGTTYGVGNGSTTFNVPDTRGEFIRGWDHGRGVDTGRALGSSQEDSIEEHIHQYQSFVSATATGYSNASNAQNGEYSGAYPQNRNTGSTGDSETRPRNVAFMYCIKY